MEGVCFDCLIFQRFENGFWWKIGGFLIFFFCNNFFLYRDYDSEIVWFKFYLDMF